MAFRGRGRGRTTQPTGRGRGSPDTRGFNNTAQRGGPINKSTFGQPSRTPTSNATPRGPSTARSNGVNRPRTQPSASSAVKPNGSWQERWQELTKARERERANAIRQGLIADPEKPRSLAEAITPTGTCRDMCAEFERVQRVVQKDVWNEETDANRSAFASTDDEPDESRMVKKFRRAAAGLEEQLPSDLRPPEVLRKTCDYLFHDVIGQAPSLAKVHHFVWDRTRAIRNDFSIQQSTQLEDLRIAIDCYERIARFHILSLHQLALPERPYSKYDWQQEREQLDRTLLSLMQYYDDSRGRMALPNEVEFRAYCVIFQLQDPTPDLEDRVQSWPREVIRDPRIQKALELYMAACNVMDAQGPLKPRANHLMARQDWQRFWKLVGSKEVSYLMACVAEIYFNLVRRTVLNALFRTTRASTSIATPDWTVDVLCDMFAFDDEEEVFAYCERFGFTFKEREDGEQYLDLTSVRGRTLPEPTAGMPKQSKTSLVEDKRFGRTLPAVIDGSTVRQAQESGLVSADERDEGMEDAVEDQVETSASTNGTVVHASSDPTDDGDSLFIPETRKPSASQPQSWAPFVNGSGTAAAATPSAFSGFSKPSTFGQPSNTAQPPSIFAQTTKPPSETTTIPDFLKPAVTTTAAATTSQSVFGFTGSVATSKPEDTTPKAFSFGQPSSGPVAPKQEASAAHHAPSVFSFPPPTLQQNPPPNETKVASLPAFKPASPTLGPASAPSFLTQQPETVQQPHFTTPSPAPIHATLPANVNAGTRRTSSPVDSRPKKPSPLINSFGPTEDNSNSAITDAPTRWQSEGRSTVAALDRQSEPIQNGDSVVAKATAAHAPTETTEDFDTTITRIANELFDEPFSGYLSLFVEAEVGFTITKVQDQLTIERLHAEADDHRRSSLLSRYGKRWRDLFWQRRHAKIGRERRQRRQRRLHERSSQGPDDTSNLGGESVLGSSMAGSVHGSSSGGLSRRRELVDSMFQQTVNDNRTTRPSPGEARERPANKRPVSSHGADSSLPPRETGHKRLKSTSHVDERGRIAKPIIASSHPHADILKRSSFLGFSMAGQTVNNKNTTKSNYFRLKAMGVHRAADLSTPRGTKRRLSESLQPSLRPPPSVSRSDSRAASPYRSSPVLSTSKEVQRAPTSASSHTPQSTEEDEALFARLKAARELLNDNESFLKSGFGQDDDFRRSLNDSQSTNESPSMERARAEARLRASKNMSGIDAGRTDREVPAYRMRESRFVPREQYGKAIERSKELRESRSRDTSQPGSRMEQEYPNATQKQPVASPRTGNASHQLSSRAEIAMSHTERSNGIASSARKQGPYQQFSQLPTSFPQFTSQASVSFANHNTQMSCDNPFLQAQTQNSIYDLHSQPAFAYKAEPSADEFQDHTIQPSQINNSLANSFGPSQGFGQSAFQRPFQYSQAPPQQDSYSQSQAISLLSDDEDDGRHGANSYGQSHNATETDEMDGELLDEATDDELGQNSYGHANPYAVLAQGFDEETDEQGFESQVEDGQEHESIEDVDEAATNGYVGEQSDDESADGDIDDDETEEMSEEEEEDFANVYEDGDEDEDEDKGNVQSPLWQHAGYGNRWGAMPAANPDLQDVGNTVEEAIELLSD